MQLLKKIRAPFFIVLLLAFITVAGNLNAWSQNAASSSAKLEQPAALLPSGGTPATTPATTRRNRGVAPQEPQRAGHRRRRSA